MRLPADLERHDLDGRTYAALTAVQGAGAALLRIRMRRHQTKEAGHQLKTAVDAAVEGWVLGYLKATFAGDAFLAEERYDEDPSTWNAQSAYWTVDALDGTRSYCGGFDGFASQVAYVVDGSPKIAAVDEPARALSWVAIAGSGAYVLRDNVWSKVVREPMATWPKEPRFIDSVRPSGAISELIARRNGVFVECGGVGAKALRVAGGEADIFIKDFSFKRWDVAPINLLLKEAGVMLGTLDGRPIDYRSDHINVAGILAAPAGLFQRIVRETGKT